MHTPQDRGIYRLTVSQLQYTEGELINDEGRPGCVAYGQMRRYKIVTTAARDATLSIHALAQSQSGLGAIYVGENQPPNERSYAAMVMRAQPSSEPLRLAISPCALRQRTTWHIGVMLEEEDLAVSRGVRPTQACSCPHPCVRPTLAPRTHPVALSQSRACLSRMPLAVSCLSCPPRCSLPPATPTTAQPRPPPSPDHCPP